MMTEFPIDSLFYHMSLWVERDGFMWDFIEGFIEKKYKTLKLLFRTSATRTRIIIGKGAMYGSPRRTLSLILKFFKLLFVVCGEKTFLIISKLKSLYFLIFNSQFLFKLNDTLWTGFYNFFKMKVILTEVLNNWRSFRGPII